MALVALAFADPVALRAPGSPVVAADLGAPSLSVAGWTGPWGGAVWTRADGGSLGLAAGVRHVPEGLGFTAHGWAGPLVSLVRPGVGFQAGGSAGLGRVGEGACHRLEVVASGSVGMGQWRVPLLLEGGSVARVGRSWLGGHGGVGVILARGRPSFAIQGGVTVGYR